jgi:hypothetical protein
VEPVVIPAPAGPAANAAKLSTVVLLSNGKLTCLSHSGERLWQTQTSAIWRKEHATLSTDQNHEAGMREESVVVPSLRYINLHSERSWEEADVEDLVLLLLGDTHLCLISTEGRVKANMLLPNAPVGATSFFAPPIPATPMRVDTCERSELERAC